MPNENTNTDLGNVRVFLLRNNPSHEDQIDQVINAKQIILGWGNVGERMEAEKPSTRDGIKDILRASYDHLKNDNYVLGYSAGCVHRFYNEMRIGDIVVIPRPGTFYVCKITSGVIYKPDCIDEDTAIRRDIEWLNGGEPIDRSLASNTLISRLKYYGTLINITDLKQHLETALDNAQAGGALSFQEQAFESAVNQIETLLTAPETNMDPRRFEILVCELLKKMGASAEIQPKNRFAQGADIDIEAVFVDLGLTIYVQAKYHKNVTDEYPIKQLIEAIKSLGDDVPEQFVAWAVTSGQFSPNIMDMAQNNRIRLVDGHELAEMIVRHGISNLTVSSSN